MDDRVELKEVLEAGLHHLYGGAKQISVLVDQQYSVSSSAPPASYLQEKNAHRARPSSLYNIAHWSLKIYSEVAFDTFWYLDNYEDVKRSSMDPSMHYKLYGEAERRAPNKLAQSSRELSDYVDGEWYLARYPDVAAANVDPRAHFNAYGRREGRYANSLAETRENATEPFAADWYLYRYLDVKESGLDAQLHYITYGHEEGRYPSKAAELHSLAPENEFEKFITSLYRSLFSGQITYFEYIAWRDLYRLGLRKPDIRDILMYISKLLHEKE